MGGGGNDTLIGNAGRDLLFGGDGLDTIFGGDGEDLIVSGKDVIRHELGRARRLASLLDGQGRLCTTHAAARCRHDRRQGAAETQFVDNSQR